MNQLGLFILWEYARSDEQRILADLHQRFDVLGEEELQWEPERFSECLSRFYGQKLPSGARKERHCGRGPFLLVVVNDTNATFEERPTSRGTEQVTASLFDAKQRYRAWTGGGHRVHSTNDQQEFEHDLWFLLGQEASDLAASRVLCSDPPKLLHGADGWDTIHDALRALELSTEHLVLRNWEGWDAWGPTDEHPDVDLLVACQREAALALGATRVSRMPGRANYRARIGDRMVDFDLRSPGDGYMPEPWGSNLLRSRQRQDGRWVPSPNDHFWSLLYHACVHKPSVAADYVQVLNRLSNNIGIQYNSEDPVGQLHRWLRANDLEPSLPKDPSVHVNLAATPGVRGAGTRSAVRNGLLGLKNRGPCASSEQP